MFNHPGNSEAGVMIIDDVNLCVRSTFNWGEVY